MKITTLEVAGFSPAILGMRNAKKSRSKSDSNVTTEFKGYTYFQSFVLGEADKKLAQNLLSAGTEHSKFMRFITVWADVDMPRYWWSEADTYKFMEKNSESTMHKLLNDKVQPITKDLFISCEEDEDISDLIIERLEQLRQEFISTTDGKKQNRLLVRAKRLLSEGFLQLRTICTNYAEIRNMYFQRKHHPLKEEWVDTFCKWVESLPFAAELICYEPQKNN